jgi:hypothetical protein
MTEAEALRMEIEALQRQHERELGEAFRAGRAFERRQMREDQRRARFAPRQLGGGWSVVAGDFDQRPAQDDFNQAPPAGEEAA